jgi:murein DD-endopeptidase MepM/ murein hydrolase activator NlpD
MLNVPYQKTWILYSLLACSLALNLVLMLHRVTSGDSLSVPPLGDAQPASEAARPAPAAVTVKDAGTQPEAAQAKTADSGAGGWSVVHANVEQSLARTFQIQAGDDGDALSSVYTRLFVFDLDLRRDLKVGDSVAVVWRKGADGLPEIAAASLQSTKLGKTVTAYRWQAPGDPFPSYWHPDGSEAALRLKVGPLDQYEQITSLLKDRPTHKGMDFKTPLGTEVHAPKDGVVTRTNWNWGANGNCIEIRYEDGVLAKFLHLSENKVAEGQNVAAGQVIALTGNTGHTTAPHLHYQLDRADKTVDPIDYHGTVRRSLAADQVAALDREAASYQTMLGEGSAR